MSFTIEEARKIITANHVVKVAKELHRTPSDLYNIRTHYKRFLGVNSGEPQPAFIPIFNQLKEEGLLAVTDTPMSRTLSLAGTKSAELRKERIQTREVGVEPIISSPVIDSAIRDPIAEIEIAFNTFKEKLNELIPLIVEEQVKEAIFRASIKGNTRRRILK